MSHRPRRCGSTSSTLLSSGTIFFEICYITCLRALTREKSGLFATAAGGSSHSFANSQLRGIAIHTVRHEVRIVECVFLFLAMKC